MVSEERGSPEQGVGGRNGLNWVCTWGEGRAQGSGPASPAETASSLPSLQAALPPASQTTSCPEPGPCPSLGSASLSVLSHCRAEAALGRDQKGEALFLSHILSRGFLSSRLGKRPWFLAAGHRPAQPLLIFHLLGDPPHCPGAPVSPAPPLLLSGLDSLSLLLCHILGGKCSLSL